MWPLDGFEFETPDPIIVLFQRKDSMEFLHDIVPKKVKYGDYLKMMEEEKSSDEEDGDLL
jgi:hypothetical protein